uniref:Uncharacterized protein n=1 Tax=virus sp. ctrcb4 TaxID=2825824 RepID=A0A8S5RPD9_9VIRU|nr:MAG TPA: hypothetical protein [virus sp. ctrcb4]DAR12595.1 MAG TPA: hypothetical protein [Crassvirales sp.]
MPDISHFFSRLKVILSSLYSFFRFTKFGF